ncbi:hypothetical protein J5N97_011839 [Dioscorea zingiberensis]|uniref:Bulb-type lectin domain-containing protein n=1 Tax=Dioscorea zingiberensis TaxID=325984 RepID=A0A9D5HNW7_9LILI|nr:hypothetical protein J5N97_011839 [Dioscorea zingiberensis]
MLGQSIGEGQTLVSANKIYELGFFIPAGSTKRYLGIWYHQLPVQTIVWVANRERPVSDSSGIFTIDTQGNFVLKPTNYSEDFLWQSFDHPTDTFLPGMVLGGQNQSHVREKLQLHSLMLRGMGMAIGCLLWFRELLGLQENYDGGQDLYYRLVASELNGISDHKKKRSVLVTILSVAGSIVVLLPCVAILYLNCGKALDTCCGKRTFSSTIPTKRWIGYGWSTSKTEAERLGKNRQTALFSATQTKEVEDFARLSFQKTPVYIGVDDGRSRVTVEGLQQGYCVIPSDKRFLVLYTFLKKHMSEKVMVFFSSCNSVKFHSELLKYIQIECFDIHGKQKQEKRTNTFFDFCKAKKGILLCKLMLLLVDLIYLQWIGLCSMILLDEPAKPRGEGGKGQALLFLLPEELQFLTYLKEKLVGENYYLNQSAKDAYRVLFVGIQLTFYEGNFSNVQPPQS